MTDTTQPSAAVATFLAPILAAIPPVEPSDTLWAASLAWAIDELDWPFLADAESIPLCEENSETDPSDRRIYCLVADYRVEYTEDPVVNDYRDDALFTVADWFGLDFAHRFKTPDGYAFTVRRYDGDLDYDLDTGRELMAERIGLTRYESFIREQQRKIGLAQVGGAK